MSYKVFISHGGEDTWVAQQLELHLKKAGADTFINTANIESGDKFEEKMSIELNDCKELIALLSPWTLDRPYVWIEIGVAWHLKMRIVVVLQGISVEEIMKNAKLPAMIKGNNTISINNVDKYFSELKKRVYNDKKGKFDK